jgi:hypothetical protein
MATFTGLQPDPRGRAALRTVALAAAAAAAYAAASVPGRAEAGPLFDSSPATCTAVNCSSVSVGGFLLAVSTTSPLPWVGQVFAGSGDCLRLDVTQQDQDLEMVAVAPDGATFRNDNRASGDTRPLVRINGARSGWYTVQVGRFDGGAAETSFTLAFGRYNLNNPNCA